jgi:hypothetical protein
MRLQRFGRSLLIERSPSMGRSKQRPYATILPGICLSLMLVLPLYAAPRTGGPQESQAKTKATDDDVAAHPSQDEATPKVERGFKGLYTGKESELKNWQQINEKGRKGQFIYENGLLRTTGGMGLLWYTKEQYKNFILRADWKPDSKYSNSGVFVRFPEPRGDPWNPVNEGHEIQIEDAPDPLHRTGSVYNFAPSTKIVTNIRQWNTMEVKVVGQHYTIRVNGEVVCEYDSPRSREGYIGLQNHSFLDKVWFRNVRIKKLP